MKISEHANYLLNEYGRLQFDYAAYCKPYGESLRNEARNNLDEYIAELEEENDRLQAAWFVEETICPDGSLKPKVSALLSRIAELEYQLEDWTNNGWAEDYKARIAELEALVEGHDPFEDFPPKERGFDCSVMVLGKFEYEDEFTPFTNWDLCVYWFDEERWHPLNGYVKGDDIVRWYALPYKERER